VIIILMGVAGSGKTTIGRVLSERLVWPFHDADDFHSDANRAKMAADIPLTDVDRSDWLASLRGLLVSKTQAGQSLVLACSALKETYRQILQVDDQTHFIYLKGTYEQIKSRLEGRHGHYMKPAMLDSQFEVLEEPAQAVIVDITMEPSVIVETIVKELHLMEIKLPSHVFLDEHRIPYTRKSFPDTTEKGAANVARALGFSERQAVKTLIFQVDTGERVLVMLGGDQNAISGSLKKAIGSRNIQMAAPEVVKETTGYIIGSIPPFCWQPEGFRTFLEASLVSEPILGVGAGQWGEEIFITPENLIKACNAIVVNLTDREKPVV